MSWEGRKNLNLILLDSQRIWSDEIPCCPRPSRFFLWSMRISTLISEQKSALNIFKNIPNQDKIGFEREITFYLLRSKKKVYCLQSTVTLHVIRKSKGFDQNPTDFNFKSVVSSTAHSSEASTRREIWNCFSRKFSLSTVSSYTRFTLLSNPKFSAFYCENIHPQWERATLKEQSC